MLHVYGLEERFFDRPSGLSYSLLRGGGVSVASHPLTLIQKTRNPDRTDNQENLKRRKTSLHIGPRSIPRGIIMRQISYYPARRLSP